MPASGPRSRGQSPPSASPRSSDLGSLECELWLGARDPETRRHHWKGIDAQALLAANPLIEVRLGLMIWTLVCFAITFFVLKRFAFGPVQKIIDERRQRIRQALDEADNARAEARRLLEEHRAMMQTARVDAEQILAEARRIAESQRERMRDELEADRQRRIEETTKQIEAETRRARADPGRGRRADAPRRRRRSPARC